MTIWLYGQPEITAAGNRRAKENMTTENAVRVLAGSMMLVSIALARFISPWFLMLGVFVGINLIQSAFTGFCPAATFFRKLGWTCDACSAEKPEAR
jgi:hypothetical protein